jgi:hypothetical protein
MQPGKIDHVWFIVLYALYTKKNCDKKIHSRRLGVCDFWDFMAAMWRQGDSLEFLFEEHILMLL